MPGYSTLNRRIQSFKLPYGIFDDVIQLLKHKVYAMQPEDRYCVMSFDEMIISKKIDYDKNEGVFVGNVTLEDDTSAGNLWCLETNNC